MADIGFRVKEKSYISTWGQYKKYTWMYQFELKEKSCW